MDGKSDDDYRGMMIAQSLPEKEEAIIGYLSELSLSEHLDELEVLAWELEGGEIGWGRRWWRGGRWFGVDAGGE